MRVALALLFFSAVLFLPCVAPATEPAQADVTAGVSEPSPGAMAKLFGWFQNLGNLKLDGEAADDEARRYQDGQYVFTNGGTKGYHFVADLSPGFRPGFYVQTLDRGGLTADLSMNDPVVPMACDLAEKPGGQKNFCLFMAPEVETGSCKSKEIRDSSLGPDMPLLGIQHGPDNGYGVGLRCGVTVKFE